MDADFRARLQDLLRDGRKIEAVKLYREEFGVGLKEAKDAVESLEGGESLPQRDRRSTSTIEADIVSLLEQGRKIDAINVYREHNGTGLKESKEAVEAIAAERGITAKSGCFGVILFVFLVLMGFSFQLLE